MLWHFYMLLFRSIVTTPRILIALLVFPKWKLIYSFSLPPVPFCETIVMHSPHPILSPPPPLLLVCHFCAVNFPFRWRHINKLWSVHRKHSHMWAPMRDYFMPFFMHMHIKFNMWKQSPAPVPLFRRPLPPPNSGPRPTFDADRQHMALIGEGC